MPDRLTGKRVYYPRKERKTYDLRTVVNERDDLLEANAKLVEENLALRKFNEGLIAVTVDLTNERDDLIEAINERGDLIEAIERGNSAAGSDI